MMESKGQDGYSESGASTPESSEVSEPSKIGLEEENTGNLKFSGPPDVPLIEQKEPCMNNGNSKYPRLREHLVIAKRDGTQESATDHSNSNSLPPNKTPKDCGHLENTTNLVTVVIPVRNQYSQEPNGDSNSKEEIRGADMLLEEDNEQMTARSLDPAIKTRSLSPGVKSENGNKRPAVICDFFARGWCIKGSSCRFLHRKDHGDNSVRKNDGEVSVVGCERKMDLGEASGSKDVCERPVATSAVSDAASSSPHALERTLLWEHGGSNRCQLDDGHKFSSLERQYSTPGNALDHQLLASLRDDPNCLSSFKDIDRESMRHIFPSDKIKTHASLISGGSSHLPQSSLFPEYGCVMSLSINHRAAFSYANSEELACNRSQFMHNDTSLIRSPLKARSNTFMQSAGMSSSCQVLNSFSSLDASPSPVQKLLDGDKDSYASRSASLMHSTSPYSGPTQECLLPIKAYGNPLHGQFKSKIPKYNWEPSVPFRPSFFIGSSISYIRSLYDPLRDNIEETNVADISSRVCTNGEDASFANTSLQDTHQNCSLSSHDGLNENILNKNCYKHEKGLLLNGVGVGTSDADQLSGTLAGEENTLGPLNMYETPITEKIDIDCDTKNRSDGERQKKDIKVDRSRQNNEVEIESKRDKDMPSESKATRHLRAALIDMVKDLLKPTWLEGHLTKDAHNVIVKKTADKIVSTLQHHQIPSAVESVKRYLSLSQSKIAKLVEAYVEKYGKS